MTLKSRFRFRSRAFLMPWWERLAASPLGTRLAKGAFWSLAGGVVSQGLSLFASIFIARMLGQTGFGELGIIQSTVGMLGTFAGFGLGLTAAKHVAEYKIKDTARAGRIITFVGLASWVTGGFMAVVLLAMGPWFARHTLAAPHLGEVLRLSSVLLLLGAVNGAQIGALSGFEAFRSIARINVIAGLATFPLMLFCASWWSLKGVVIGMALGQTLNCILNHVGLRAEAHRAGVPLVLQVMSTEWNILWYFSLPAVLSGLMIGPVNWACNVIVVNQPGGYGEIGLFNAANQWRQAILFFPSMLAAIALPMLSNLQGAKDSQRYTKILKATLGLSLASSLVIALPCVLLSPWIMARYGESFLGGSDVLVLICIVSVIMALLNVVGQTIASDGRMWFGLLLNAVWAVVLLGSCSLFRERGALGLCLANLAAYSVHMLSVSLYVYCRHRPRIATMCGCGT